MTLRGRLAAGDLGRLERACGSALEREHIELELRLTAGSSMDDTARAFVQRLIERGALVVDAEGKSFRSHNSSPYDDDIS